MANVGAESGWHVRLHGQFALTGRDGYDATPRGRKARALVAWLALQPGRAASREALCALLWSDRGRDQARASLRQCLHELREVSPDLIAADKDTVALKGVGTAANGFASGRFLEGLDHLDPAFDRWLADARAAASEKPPAAPTGPGPAAALPPAPARRWWPFAAAAVLLATYAGLWPSLHPGAPVVPGPIVIAIVPFTATPPDPATRAIADRLVADARAWMPAQRAVIRVSDIPGDRLAQARRLGADWVVSGEVIARPSPTVRARIDTSGGAVLWSRDFDAPGGRLSEAAASAATRLGTVVTCSMFGPRVRRPDEAQAALMNACDHLDFNDENYTNEASIVGLRRFVARAPNDALAHALLGTGLAVTADEMPPAVAAAQRAESARELDLANSIDPRVSELWLGRYALLPDNAPFARGLALLAHGLSIEPDAPYINSFMAQVLAEVGRSDEAVVYARRAIAFAPASVATTASAAEILAQDGQPRAALELLDAADAHHPRNHFLTSARFTILLRGGDPAGARALLDRAGDVPGFIELADQARMRRETFAIQNPHGPEAAGITRDYLARAEIDEDAAKRAVMVFPAIGRPDLGIAFALKHRVPTDIFFRPSSHAILYDRRFPGIARFQGLWEYWESTGHWPDVCRDPALPWRCGADGVKRPSTAR